MIPLLCRRYLSALSQKNSSVIEIPYALQKQHERAKKRERDAKRGSNVQKVAARPPGQLIIACKDRKLNHYSGQRYGDEPLLASRYWHKSKAIDDHFVIRCHIKDPSFDDSAATFDDGSFCPELVANIHSLGITKMSVVQKGAVPLIQSGLNVAIAAEAGSGKTIAYLVPLIELLHRWKSAGGSTEPQKPLAFVLCSSRELVNQVFAVTSHLIQGTTLKATFAAGFDQVYPLQLDVPQDIFITTAGTLSHFHKLGAFSTEGAKFVVVDEADTLLDSSFIDIVFPFLKSVDFRHSIDEDNKAQLVLASATMSPDIDNLLDGLLPAGSVEAVTTDALHRVQSNIEHRFYRVALKSAPEKLLMQLRKDYKEGRHYTLVFVNEEDTCSWLHWFLTECSIPCEALNGSVPGAKRDEIFSSFRRRLIRILVATDLASRGLDTGFVDRVVNFQFPRTITDYLHRVGRIGRINATNTGVVYNFISRAREVQLTQQVERAVRLSLRLDTSTPDMQGKQKAS